MTLAPPARLRGLVAHLRPWRGWLLAALALGALASIAGACEPLFYRYLLDLIVRLEPGSGGLRLQAANGRLALEAVAGLVALHLGQQALQTLETLAANRVRFDSSFALATRLLDHLVHQPLGFHQESGSGYLVTRMDRGVAALGELTGDLLQSLAPNLANLLAIAFLMVHLSPRLALVALAPLPLFLGLTVLAARRTVAAEEEVQEGWSRVYRRVAEVLGTIKTVKSLGREADEVRTYRQAAEGVFRRLWRLVWAEAGFQNARSLLALAGRAAVLLDGMHLVMAGRLTPGSWMAAVTYAGMIYLPLASLAGSWSGAGRALVAAGAVFDFLAQHPPVAEAPGAVELPRLRGEVRFDRVSYAYPVWDQGGRCSTRRHAPVLHEVSFHVQPGEVVAVVGPSGGGKTTLLDLLLRFYDPEEGAVCLDGYDLRRVTQASLRRQVAVVLQEPVLLQGTIAENIAYGRPGASRDEIEAAARGACAHDFILAQPHGYRTRVGERGAALSGGQKQRIAIARALLRDARVLVLDEATSQLDGESEQAVHQALRNLMYGRTTFLISHHLATLPTPDRVLVLVDGRIVETGTPAELMRRNGVYARWMREARAGAFRAASGHHRLSPGASALLLPFEPIP